MIIALQCLLNVVPLTDYFLSELHLQEINEENFLGSKGDVTHAYAKLVKFIYDNFPHYLVLLKGGLGNKLFSRHFT